jgi:hypothetical protein
MKAFTSILLTVTFLLGAFFALSPISHAQTSEGVEIKPGVIEDKVNPGDTYRFTLRVKNVSDTTQTYIIQKEDISGLDEQGRPVFATQGQATGYELSTWITPDQNQITVGAGETQAVAFTAHVPREATPGSHFGGVFFTVPASKTSTNGSGVGIQVGAVISLKISGNVTEDARLREFSTEHLVYDTADVSFKLRMENLGNVLLRPHGVIDISDMRGKKVSTISVNDSAAPIFPATSRTYLPAWKYDSFALGRYQAVVSIVYGDDSRKTVSSVTSFWVLPMKPILSILGALIAFMLVLYIGVRRYIKNKLKEMGITAGKGGDASYYEKKYNKSTTRMMILVSCIFLFVLVCLAALFLMFA